MWLTLFVVGALVTLSFADIRSTFLGDKVSILGKESMEEWPATVATLVHVVAGHEVLCGKLWHFLTIFDLKSVFGDLCERDGIAGTAVTLISVLVHEVIAANISPVKVLWELRVWD